MIGPDHAVTALHVIEGISSKYPSLALGKHDGLYSAEIAFADEPADIAVLRAVKHLEPAARAMPQPVEYPAISTELPDIGMSVGHLSWLSKLNDVTQQRQSSIFFSSGFVSHYIREPETRWGVIGGFCEEGFSGAPVFLIDGSLIGVLVETSQTGSETSHPIPQTFLFPIISALAPFREQILAVANRKVEA